MPNLTSGDFLADKIFSWVIGLLHNHPIVVSKKKFEGASKRLNKEEHIGMACAMGLIEANGGYENICINPAFPFEEQKHTLFHEGVHLLFASLDDEFIGTKVWEDEKRLEKEIVELEEYIWRELSRSQKDLFGVLLKNRRDINPVDLPVPKRGRCG